ncbi:MAG: hypothetical protein ACOYT9_00340 [Patescibacteria group bacterium]
MKKTALFFVAVLFATTIFTTSSVAAATKEFGSETVIPLVNPDDTSADNQVSGTVEDSAGNFFYRHTNQNPDKLRKIASDGTHAWTIDLPATEINGSRLVPDNQGGIYYLYYKNDPSPSVQSMYLTHYNANGTANFTETELLNTAFSVQTEYAAARSNGDLYIIFAERNHGDSFGKVLKFKVMVVNTSGAIQNTMTTRTLNPTEHRWCTNRGTSYEVPYDLPYNGGVLWSACWEWCQTQFLSTPGTCQYNADGPRSCWVNEFPVGGVDNCSWSDFGSAPPYSGYSGMTQSQETSIAETFLSYNTLDNVYPMLSIQKAVSVSDGLILYYYLYEMDYDTTPSTNTASYYIQKLDATGEPQFAGRGIDVTAIQAVSEIADVHVYEDGIVTIGNYDTDLDGYEDTVKMQKYDFNLTPAFPGDGVEVFQHIDPAVGVYAYSTMSGSKVGTLIELWHDSIPASGNVYKVYTQTMDLLGNKLLDTNGVLIADSSDSPEPEYAWDIYPDNNGGFYSLVYYLASTPSPDRVFRLTQVTSSNEMKYSTIRGLQLPISDNDGSRMVVTGTTPYIFAYGFGPYFQKTYALRDVYQVDLADGWTAINVENDRNVEASSDYGADDATVELHIKVGGELVAGPTIDLTADRNWLTVGGSVDAANYKSILFNLSNAAGVTAGQNVMYVPSHADHPNVRVCPGAISGFEVITADCADGVNFDDGDTRTVTYQSGDASITATKVTVDSAPYWKLVGAKGTGAVSGTYPTASASIPTVTSDSVVGIISSAATVNGNVTSDGGSAITERGAVYSSTSTTPTLSDTKQIASGTTGSMTFAIVGLQSGTHYYLRAYATNAEGTAYGSVIEFDTPASAGTSPTVTTGAVSSIGETAATVAGDVTSDGGETITERGIVFSSSNNTPTTANGKFTAAGTTGAYTATLTGLTLNTTYYARAYAINSEGTSYGSVVTFKTLEPAALRSVYFTFSKFRYNKYASPTALRSGDTAYIKNYNTSKIKLIQVFLYDYAKKGNQGFTKSRVTTTSMFLRTSYNLATGKRYAYVMKFQDKATGIVATKYFVVYTTKTWNGQSTL